ncbi:glutaminyl-tRNA synthetase [Serratia symbiotica str. 'Cinara cedri']|nr:glutaminyl-tRNA synthetase [Serratia symbiotica str. 'Cinara cedri']
MSEAKSRSINFIRQIIDNDLALGKYTSVHTRFPPEPNGYLHIGHAKSIYLNFSIAQDYNGQCNLRFDDTNPVKENIEFVESIKCDLEWLGFEWSGDIHYSSDYFSQLYQYAIELITKNLAYVDELSPEQIREYRGSLVTPGKDSPYRNRSVGDNLTLFEKMRHGEFAEGAACLRAKIDMSSSSMIMRDPVLYRIKFACHHQTGNEWCIYPMYDFTHCISDSIEGITHSLCTLEFQDNRRLYDWILDNITVNCHPHQYEFSRLNLEYTITSKRKLNQLVTEKYVEGWDDPRMPTLSGLRRRGYTAAAILNFCKRIGVTKQDNKVEMTALESCIREDLNKHAPRVMAVLEPVKVIIENMGVEQETIIMPNHPHEPKIGVREVLFSRELYIDRADFREEANKQYKRLVLHKEVRLRYAYVIKAERVEKNLEGEITTIFCSYDPETMGKDPSDGRKVKGVIHWVSATHALPAEIRLYDRLFNVPNPAAGDFIININPRSLIIKQGFVEPSLATAQPEQAYQFEREGYFCADSRYSSSGNLVFNRTVSLRNTWVNIGY